MKNAKLVVSLTPTLQKAAAQCEQNKVDLTRAREENTSLLASREALAKEVQDLRCSLAQMRAQLSQELDVSKQQGHEAGWEAGLKEGMRRGKQEAQEEKFFDGIAHCRSHILMSPPGQKFFDTLMQGLPQDYLHSHAFRQELLPSLSNMIAAMLLNICDQLQMTERVGEVDINQVLPEVLECAPTVDPTQGENYPWYLDTLKSAAAVFRGHRRANAPAIVYPPIGQIDHPVHAGDTAAARTLQMAFDAVRGGCCIPTPAPSLVTEPSTYVSYTAGVSVVDLVVSWMKSAKA